MNYYNSTARRVEPMPTARPITIAQQSQLGYAWPDETPPPPPPAYSVIDSVFQPQNIGTDPYSPLERAAGLALRTAPFALVYIILAFGIVDRMALADGWIYLLFGLPMLITVALMSDRTDRYTPAGIEIERIAAAERTALATGERQERILSAHLAHQQELRRMALESTIRMLERGTQEVPADGRH